MWRCRKRLARACLGLLLLCCAGTSGAMWAALSDAELLRSSDLIVVGEWQGQTALTPGPGGAATSVVGSIRVSEVLKGPEVGFALVALPSANGPLSGEDVRFRRGERGLWLLRLRPGSQGLYLADHPQRFVSEKQKHRVLELRQQLSR